MCLCCLHPSLLFRILQVSNRFSEVHQKDDFIQIQVKPIMIQFS